MHQLLSVIEMSSILCLVSLAAVITFRFAGFPDLSVDGVFALGAVVFAKFVVLGYPIGICILFAFLSGAISGCVTASISNKLKIHPLLASVLVLTILYSVNLRVLGKSNQPLFGLSIGIFNKEIPNILVFLIIAAISILLYFLIFKTELGCALRSTGGSPSFLVSVGKNVSLYKVILVAAAGSLVATSGSLLAYRYGFADISIGNGIIIIGIASLIIGEKISGSFLLWRQFLSVPIGILIFQLAVGLALSVGISPTDVKLMTGIITIVLLAFGRDDETGLFT